MKGATPFADLFNPQDPLRTPNGTYISTSKGRQPPYRLLTSVEFDYQFLHKSFGNFGVGLTTGYYRRTTHSFQLAPDGSPCVVPYCVRSGDQTGLNILPLSALFIYRFDYLAKRFHIPLVPYVEGGPRVLRLVDQRRERHPLGRHLPRPTADMKAVNPSSGYGGTFGFVVTTPAAPACSTSSTAVCAKTMDAELGINHTYLFCEFNYANITGFGASHRSNLSDTMVNSGLGFEF